MEALRPSKEDTSVYHFTLIKRVRHTLSVSLIYSLVLLVFILIIPFVWGAGGTAVVVAGLPALHLLYAVVAWTLRPLFPNAFFRVWRFRNAFPWFGYLPPSFVSLHLLLTIHLHWFGIGVAAIALLLPWMPLYVPLIMLVLHGWSLIPRLLVLFLFHLRCPDGLVDIRKDNISCYHS